jgi:hypothetical protein
MLVSSVSDQTKGSGKKSICSALRDRSARLARWQYGTWVLRFLGPI